MPIHAAVMTAFEQPLEIRQYPLPDHLEDGELLARVTMAGICGTDVHLWLGQLPIPLPNILGHETVGVIEQMAGEVRDYSGRRLQVGDRITWASSIVCGECFYCRRKRAPTRCLSRKAYGISYNCEEAPHLRGGYAEMIHLRRGTTLFALPETLSTEAVIGAGCALNTAIHGIERAPVRWGDAVVIQGAGPVGLAALAVAKQSGAGKVIVVGGPAARLELAREFGADLCIDLADLPDPAERRERVLFETEGYGADVVIECVGHPQAVNEGLDLCRDGAQYLVLGQYANAGTITFNPHTITRKQLNVVGSWAFEPRHVFESLRLLDLGWAARFARQVTHKFPLAEANAALDTTRRWASGKTAICPNG
jgi:threonine dehydrogenase-like Zn-dependent dehydrogenase